MTKLQPHVCWSKQMPLDLLACLCWQSVQIENHFRRLQKRTLETKSQGKEILLLVWSALVIALPSGRCRLSFGLVFCRKTVFHPIEREEYFEGFKRAAQLPTQWPYDVKSLLSLTIVSLLQDLKKINIYTGFCEGIFCPI